MRKHQLIWILTLLLLFTGVPKKEASANQSILIKDLGNGYAQIYNYVDGYTFKVKNEYSLDLSMAPVRTRLYNEQTVIDIYYDNFTGTIDDKNTYMNYANNFINDKKNHQVLKNEWKKINGYDAHLLKWTRNKLKHVDQDKNYYFSAEIAKNKYEVYTIIIKSTTEIKNENIILDSFHFLAKTANPAPIHFPVIEKNWNQETSDYYQNTFVNNEKLQWGLFDATFFTDLTKTKELENKLQYKFSVLLRYLGLGRAFPMDEFQSAYADGRTVELTLQNPGEDNDKIILYEILSGKYDDFFNHYAEEIKKFGHPILFRPFNEMNSDWVAYSSYFASKDPDLYVEAWKYIHRIFENHSVENVLWVWNPNHESKPNFKWNHPLMYFPGSEYVDIIGLTAYNTGTYYPGEKWTSFKDLYDPLYQQYTEWFDHPMMITEFSSSSIGGDKVRWIDDMFSEITKYDRIKVAVWWSWQDLDGNGNPARIYFLDENDLTINVFKNRLIEY